MRAATVGPTDYIYTSAMPFTMEAEKAAERLLARRAASVEPVLPRPFTYPQAYQSGGSYSAFDYKVIDYANRLDREETTRCYINERKSYVSNYDPTSYRSHYDYYSAKKHDWISCMTVQVSCLTFTLPANPSRLWRLATKGP